MLLNDSEAKVDLLNFSATANAVAAMIRSSVDEPLSIGVFGDWGSGKTSLVKLIADSLRHGDSSEQYVFIEFNAWLYQGFDDAKMALLRRVSDELLVIAKDSESLLRKVRAFIKRVNYLRVVKLGLSTIGGALVGGAVGGPMGALAGLLRGVANLNPKEMVDGGGKTIEQIEKVGDDAKQCIAEESEKSLPQELDELRKSFGEILGEANKRIIVLVDDLDRCLPETAVSTLEAMRLLLFTSRSVFIIAADENAIKNAVRLRYHIEDVDEKLVTNYYDKLVQVPVAVPHPSYNEIRCYLTGLLAETAQIRGVISKEDLQAGCKALVALMAKPWHGKITTNDIDSAFGEAAQKIRLELDLAGQMLSVMSQADVLAGNPRLMKRFVNAAVIRRSIADSQQVPCQLDALIKLMLLERCSKNGEFGKIHREVLESEDGISKTLSEYESNNFGQGQDISGTPDWLPSWVKLPPKLSDIDLRPLMYYSRDVASWNYDVPEELSQNGAEIFKALMSSQSVVSALVTRIRSVITKDEASLILRRLMSRAASARWDSKIVISSFTLVEAHKELEDEYLSYFRRVIPRDCLSPAFVSNIALCANGKAVFEAFLADSQISSAVKKSIQAAMKRMK